MTAKRSYQLQGGVTPTDDMVVALDKLGLTEAVGVRVDALLAGLATEPLSGATDPTVAADFIGQFYVRTAVPYGLFFSVTTGPSTIWVRL